MKYWSRAAIFFVLSSWAPFFPAAETDAVRQWEEKLKGIVIPQVEFSETPVSEAVRFLGHQSAKADPEGEGVPISADESVAGIPITLRLTNVPLGEALRYVSTLARARFTVTADGVIVRSMPSGKELFTNVYVVPPTFSQPASAGLIDPFAPEADSSLEKRKTAKQILEEAGVTFPEGGSAIFSPVTSQLIVRNTADQMELVEAYIESICSRVELQVYVTTRFFVTDQLPPGSPLFGNREGMVLGVGSEEEMKALLSSGDLDERIRKKKGEKGRPVSRATLTDPQYQVLLRSVKDSGSTIHEMPAFMARSGQGFVVTRQQVALGIVPRIGEDGFTIDLSVTWRGEQLGPEGAPVLQRSAATVWDGHVLLLHRKTGDGKHLCVGIRSVLLDPAGERVGREPLPEEPHPGIEGNLFPEDALPDESDDLSPEQVAAVIRADEIALEAARAFSREEFRESSKLFRKALRLLPRHELTEERERAYLQQWLRAVRSRDAK